MVGTVNLTINQGETWTQNIYRKNKKTGVPIDLTSYTARFDIAETKGGSPVLSLTTENGGISITAAAGKIALTATKTQTAGLTFSTAYYDLELYSGSEVKRLLEGTVTLNTNVTIE